MILKIKITHQETAIEIRIYKALSKNLFLLKVNKNLYLIALLLFAILGTRLYPGYVLQILGPVHTETQSFRSIFVPVSGTQK